MASTTLTPERKKFLVYGLLALAAIIVLVWGIMSLTGTKTWTRADLPAVTTAADRGDTLDSMSQDAGQPTLIMALANNQRLQTQYPETCDPVRYRDWPQRTAGYFCNDRLNLRQANTLVPNQQVRVLALDSVSLSPAMTQTLGAAGSARRVAVLVDGRSQGNLDHAAAIAAMLQDHGHLAGIWVYTQAGMFEFIDRGRAIAFNRENQGVVGALTALSVQPIDRVVVVTGSTLRDVPSPRGMQPVIGYCMNSSCEPGMQRLTKATRGHYVPFAAG